MARKKNFDPEATLLLAVEMFWRKGYANTSLNDLVEHLGINRFSLYSTYGDKKNLYHQALNYYIDNFSVPALSELCAQDSELDDLLNYFSYFAKLQTSQTSGCFVQNAILELSLVDDDVGRAGQRLYSLILKAIENVLANAQRRDQIGSEQNIQQISHFLLLQIQGIRVLGKAKQYDVLEDAMQIITLYITNLRR
ncbi:MAG: putative transcriptional regulator, TetR family protein [Osedax symbiont Rs2]|nr:MAG: putative transcriptional regulator, TetR family protein [Osedax symbiont Rs2]